MIYKVNCNVCNNEMFKGIKSKLRHRVYGSLTDNGPEFGGTCDTNEMTAPVKRLFYEMGIKHCKINHIDHKRTVK